MISNRFLTTTVAGFLAVEANAAGPRFDELSVPLGPSAWGVARCISSDGRITGGGFSQGANGGSRENAGPMFWTNNDPGQFVTTYSPGSRAEIRALTPDGRLGVGVTEFDPVANVSGPVVWDLVLGQARGLAKTVSWSSDAACAVNQDGTIIVGRNAGRAVVWVGNNQPVQLISAPYAAASAVSADGSTIVGSFGPEDVSGSSAFVWTASSGAVQIPSPLQGASHTRALALTPDGAIAVGYSGNENGSGAMVRWTLGAGGAVLSTDGLSPSGYCFFSSLVHTGDDYPIAVSASGDVVGGTVDGRAILWTEGSGLLDLAAIYEELVPPPAIDPEDPTESRPLPHAVTGVSADGREVVGVLYRFDGRYSVPASWKLTLPPRCDADANFNGVADTQDLVRLLGAFGLTVPFGTRGDSNGDGFVDNSDLVRLLAGFGSPCPQ